MADPTIQTFCCHHGNNTEQIMQEFNTNSYNIVCLVSSILGILGAIYQILPRQEFSNKHKWLSFSALRGRKIIVCLAIADLFAALGVFLRSLVWINFKNIMPAIDDDSSVVFCAIFSAMIQYFYTATWIWTLIYAIDIRLILNDRASRTSFYHFFAWGIPAVSTAIGLAILYLPDAKCNEFSANLRVLPNYIANYIPIILVMISNPFIYNYSSKDMERILTSTTGQFTSKEREILDAIKVKFSVINCVFYLCWAPNLLNGIMLWILWFKLPTGWIIAVWYIMALLNPLQALFNCMVYRRWRNGLEKIILPCRKIPQTNFEESNSSAGSAMIQEEILPLLQSAPCVRNYR